MKEEISFCGLICAECPVYIATKTKNEKMKEQVAKDYSTKDCVLEAADITCMGCHANKGICEKFCAGCEIRNCGQKKEITDCSECEEYSCQSINTFVPKESNNRIQLESKYLARIKDEFDSEYCNVKYMKKDNVVLLTWKKFSCKENYRIPTLFASYLLHKYKGCSYIVDARNGFEDEKEDVEWGFSVLLPHMAASGCQKWIFIMNEVNDIEDEMNMWFKEIRKYFQVIQVTSYEEAIRELV